MNATDLKLAVENRTISPSDFLSELWKLSTGMKRQGRKYSPGQLVVYRSRVYHEDIRPKEKKDVSYPPIAMSKLQRASGIGEQVFYASAGLPTTLAESRVQAGEFLAVSKWKNTGAIALQEVGFLLNEDEREKLYHSIFTHPGDELYEYSSRVGSHLMNGPALAGLLYPSIINRNQSHNVALRKAFVDDALMLASASFYRVKSISSDSQYEVEELDFALPVSGDMLEWKGRKKKWDVAPGGELKFVSNGWDWDAFLPDGTYVEPQ